MVSFGSDQSRIVINISLVESDIRNPKIIMIHSLVTPFRNKHFYIDFQLTNSCLIAALRGFASAYGIYFIDMYNVYLQDLCVMHVRISIDFSLQMGEVAEPSKQLKAVQAARKLLSRDRNPPINDLIE